jgi:hypothetical protein
MVPPASLTIPVRKRPEPIGVLAVVLAIILMIVPLEADLLWVLHQQGRYTLQKIVWIFCFLVVFVPFIVSWRRMHLHPGRWRGRYNRVLTGIILCINIAFAIMARHYHAL